MSAKKIAQNGILTAIALGIFVIEAQLPPLTAIPGIKLGLSNIVTLFALVFMTGKDAWMILTARLLLSALFFGNPIMLLYSIAGGFSCLAIEYLLLKRNSVDSLWAISAIGAMVHNTAQILVAVLVTKTTAVLSFLPFLLLSGIITGLFTGFSVHYLFKHHKQNINKIFRL